MRSFDSRPLLPHTRPRNLWFGGAIALFIGLTGCGDDTGGADGSDVGGASGTGGATSGGSGNGATGGGSTGGTGSGGSGNAGNTNGGGSGGGGMTGPTVYEEIDGLVVVEAEHFDVNDDNGTPRSWTLTLGDTDPGITPDPDPPHGDSASNTTCLEGLPDTRVTHDDELIVGTNFFPNGGDGPILSYRVHFNTPGTYIVWVRAYSTGGEDNGIHVGVDGDWPESGERLQFCSGKNKWTWSSAQRDSGGTACGEPKTISVDVPTAGEHIISFSMREDGFEFDKWIMSNDDGFEPQDEGPAEVVFGN